MLKHSLTFIWRNALRHKSSSLINIVGLTIGLSVSLWIFLWLRDEVRMDRFHEKDARLFQVIRVLPHAEGDSEMFRNNSDLLAPALKAEMPEVEDIVAVSDATVKGILSADDKNLKVAGRFADKDFFHIFSYSLIEGAPETVLLDKYSIVISADLANRLFGTTLGLIGKPLTLDAEDYGGNYIISGVFEQAPYDSQPFDFLGTYALYLSRHNMDMNWDSNTVYTYLTLREDADPDAFDLKIRDFARDKFEAQFGNENLHWIGRLFLRRFSDRYLYNTYVNGVQSGGKIDYVILFGIVGAFVLVIACINFMNMATARASTRMKEIGIKKTVGAGRRTLALQYLGECLATVTLSAICALGVVYVLLPQLNTLSGKHLALTLGTPTLAGLATITLFTGILAGTYPAFYLSALRPVDVLKGKLRTAFGEIMVRKGLVVFQFCISMLLIISVLIVKRQVEYVKDRNLGYSRDHVITFEAEGPLLENMNTFLTEIRNTPGVLHASSMSGNLRGSYGGGGGVEWEGKDHRIEFAAIDVNYDMMETLAVTMAEGRMFSPRFPSDSMNVIFNETAIRQMNLKDPIGRHVKLWGQDAEIVGVVKDFNFESLYDEVKPFMFRFSTEGENVMVKILAGRERDVIGATQSLYAQFNHDVPFNYSFLDDDYATLYASEERVGDMSSYFAAVAILISALGLLSLVSFATARRRKEIGMRRVLGASVAGIVVLLCWDFLRLVAIAAVIALPLGYFGAREWLHTFAFRMDLQWWDFMLAVTVAFILTCLLTGSHALRAASANPVETLRSE